MGYIVGALSKLNPFFGPPITGDQVQLLQIDNIVAAGANTIADLGVTVARRRWNPSRPPISGATVPTASSSRRTIDEASPRGRLMHPPRPASLT